MLKRASLNAGRMLGGIVKRDDPIEKGEYESGGIVEHSKKRVANAVSPDDYEPGTYDSSKNQVFHGEGLETQKPSDLETNELHTAATEVAQSSSGAIANEVDRTGEGIHKSEDVLAPTSRSMVDTTGEEATNRFDGARETPFRNEMLIDAQTPDLETNKVESPRENPSPK
eukprot:CAMPEP_0118723354 /NCGR_PEP_ID=MMETSP0800-20121206/31958_1 /TAXON_ID=210618 ORGANISM="Striatella unipunctata, Strain CCMP2910" /NCGR_SAMPLE_ID=MMETSP0800 /ASSEMBLY_ACC=CAM_ASM_000638 /LENGTH=169 /DNA_ID=CAMNT_0006631773 /DNA_START=136 /DNA_END=645 /DNA_ORIENTATION=-